MIKKLLTALFISSALLTNAQTGLTNLDFENWTGSTPTGFIGLGVSQQSTGAQSGTYFPRITITTPSGPLADGIMVLGFPPATLGAPYALRPNGIDGYYRCSFAGTDSMAIGSGLSLNGNDVASIDFFPIFQPTAVWTQFSLPFNYVNGNNPDSMALLFYANKYYINNIANTAGSYLEVDNVTIDLGSGMAPYADAHMHIQLYPNPATDMVYISSPDLKMRYATVHDLTGRLVKSYDFNAQPAAIDVSTYENGVYTYSVKDEYGAIKYSGKFVVAR